MVKHNYKLSMNFIPFAFWVVVGESATFFEGVTNDLDILL